MTTDTVTTPSGPTQDPLRRLHRRIERAQQPSADPAPTGEVHASDKDPLEALKRRIDEASDPSTLRRPAGRTALPPLSDLLATVEHARTLLEEPIGYPRKDEGDDPIERMHRQMDREADEIGRRAAIAVPRETAPEPSSTPPSDRADTDHRPAPAGGATDAVGREVLRMLESRELPGGVRAEAVARLAQAIETDDRAEMREVLRLLIQG